MCQGRHPRMRQRRACPQNERPAAAHSTWSWWPCDEARNRLTGRGCLEAGRFGDGDDEQVHLVDEVVIEQPPDQGAAAVHLQLTPRLVLSARRWPPRRHRRGRSCSPSAVRRGWSIRGTWALCSRHLVIWWLPGSSAAARARSSNYPELVGFVICPLQRGASHR